MDEKIKKMLEDYTKNAKIINEKPRPWRRGRSSLHDLIKTKEQGERLMSLIEWSYEWHKRKNSLDK